MATAVVPSSVSGGNHVKTSGILSVNSGAFVKTQSLTFRSKTSSRTKRNMTIHAQDSDHSSSSGADFIAGFALGGAVFGTLTYIFAPQIRRTLLNETEHGFRKARRPIYYDELENPRHSLHEKINQLNSAIDKVASRLRGGKLPQVPVKADAEEAAF